MKKVMFVIVMMMIFVSGAFAQTEVTSEEVQFAIDLSTFGGIVGLISSAVTQIFKAFPSIDGSKIAKIGISVGVGLIVCMLIWWQTLVYGVAAGLSGCGFYDLVKVVWGLFKPKMK